MRDVTPREFRIRQLGLEQFVAEELVPGKHRRFLWRRWQEQAQWIQLDHDGDLRTRLGSMSFQTEQYARNTIRKRKEALLSADEFPILIYSETWDGHTSLRDVRGLMA